MAYPHGLSFLSQDVVAEFLAWWSRSSGASVSENEGKADYCLWRSHVRSHLPCALVKAVTSLSRSKGRVIILSLLRVTLDKSKWDEKYYCDKLQILQCNTVCPSGHKSHHSHLQNTLHPRKTSQVSTHTVSYFIM